MFEKFDTDADGTLSREEFESALRSITGQVAPNAIVNAIFGALDSDSSGSLELAELLSIVETGSIQKISSGESINVSGHVNDGFNGDYAPQNNDVNGKKWYRNGNGCMLYFYSSDSGSSESWNLDDRIQDGSNDWYRGGWTRAPSDGSPPLGTRRWVGVGNLSLQSSSASSEEPVDSTTKDDAGVIGKSEKQYSQESDLRELMSEIDMASKYFEEQVSEGNISVDQAIEMADAAFERKSQELPFFMRAPAKTAWDAKMGSFEGRLRTIMPDPETIAAGAVAIGAVGAVASSASENLPPAQVSETVSPPPPPPPMPPPETETPPPPMPPPETETPAPSDPEPETTKPSFSLNLAISDFENARTLSERASVRESHSGISGTVQIRVNSVERTFGIGISDAYRGGNTLIAKVEGIGEVEVRMPSSSSSNEIKNGHEAEIQVSIADWNAVRKRIILESQ